MEAIDANEMMRRYLGERKFNFFYSFNFLESYVSYVGIASNEEIEEKLKTTDESSTYVTESAIAICNSPYQFDCYVLALEKSEADELIMQIVKILKKGNK